MFKRGYIQQLLSCPFLSPALAVCPQVLIYSCNRSAYGKVHELSVWWTAKTSVEKRTQAVLCVRRRVWENASECAHRIDTAVALRLIGSHGGGFNRLQRLTFNPEMAVVFFFFLIWPQSGARSIRTFLQFLHPDMLFSSQDILLSKVLSAQQETNPNKVFLFKFSSIHHWYTNVDGKTGIIAI